MTNFKAQGDINKQINREMTAVQAMETLKISSCVFNPR